MKSEIKNGVLKTYWENSTKLQSEISYRDGMYHGSAKFFTSDGKIYQEILYDNDEIIRVILYYNNGQIKLDEQFLNNERNGISKCYDVKGNVLVEDKYKDNKLIERKIFRLGIITF